MWALVHALRGDDVRDRVPRVFRLTRGYVEYADAVLLGRQGRHEEAEAALAAADVDLADIRWRRNHARLLAAGAAFHDGWGDPVAWLREALADFEERGQQVLAAASRLLLRKAGASVPRRGKGDAAVPPPLRRLGVTSREMDVLLLVAEGLLNPQIAARLSLSRRTVETHVASLLAKTGARDRWELTALANSVSQDA